MQFKTPQADLPCTGMSKWLLTFCIEQIKHEHAQHSAVLLTLDVNVSNALKNLNPLHRPMPNGFSNMTLGTFSEWKRVILVFFSAVCMLCSGETLVHIPGILYWFIIH